VEANLEPADLDLSAAVPPIWVRATGALLGASGFFVVGAAGQLLIFFYLVLWVKVVIGVLAVLGLALIAIAPWVIKARSWACITGTGLALLAAAATTVWVIFAISIAVFSPLAMMAAAMCALATLAMPWTIPASLRVTAARRALYA